jgi:hypothetical protein
LIELGDIISWTIIFVGWYIINRQNNNRETRKEVRESLLSLYRHLDEIETDAIAYHTGDGDPLLARKIKRDIDQIPGRISLAQRGSMKGRYAHHLIRFRQAITLNNFDTASFVQKEPTDRFFDEIVVSKRSLIHCLDLAYNHAYP